ncbi:YtxH domain-containing protein [Daejeonella sp. H1SJ63]|jgi:gas vesicle protein|uniref:YtxH domain-containing protein n=1 Tax=Daejeonella sp. H1SJ63 TaxID=3034145 RepID=UPI0023EB29D1|nr:YtxH domain-containing protein [Daejeonella sp. H1SJ63]
MSDNSKILAALLAGLAAGVAIGILFAPDKGSETRDKLNDSLKNLGDSIKDRAADEIGNLTEFKEKVVEGIKSKLKSAEEEYTSAGDALSHAAQKAEKTIKKATHS